MLNLVFLRNVPNISTFQEVVLLSLTKTDIYGLCMLESCLNVTHASTFPRGDSHRMVLIMLISVVWGTKPKLMLITKQKEQSTRTVRKKKEKSKRSGVKIGHSEVDSNQNNIFSTAFGERNRNIIQKPTHCKLLLQPMKMDEQIFQYISGSDQGKVWHANMV